MNVSDLLRMPEAPPDHYWRFGNNGLPELAKKDVQTGVDFVCWGYWGYQSSGDKYTIFIGPLTSRTATRNWQGQGEDNFYNDLHVAVMCVALGQWEV